MGLYDELICEEVEHGDQELFQTKDIECMLTRFELKSDGLYRLTQCKDDSWSQENVDPPEKLNYTGTINFYSLLDNGDWIEYWALLDHGKVLWIKPYKEEPKPKQDNQ